MDRIKRTVPIQNSKALCDPALAREMNKENIQRYQTNIAKVKSIIDTIKAELNCLSLTEQKKPEVDKARDAKATLKAAKKQGMVQTKISTFGQIRKATQLKQPAVPAEQQPALQKGDVQCSQTPKALVEKQSTGLSIDTREPTESEMQETERPSV